MAHFVNLCVSLKPETNILLAAVTMHKLVWDSGNLTRVLKWVPRKIWGSVLSGFIGCMSLNMEFYHSGPQVMYLWDTVMGTEWENTLSKAQIATEAGQGTSVKTQAPCESSREWWGL